MIDVAHFTAELLDSAIAWAGAEAIRVAVETGTFEGETTGLLCARFPIVHTIELEPQRWRRCVATKGHIGAVFHLGDSAEIVGRISAAYQDVPVLWYLDAHWFSPQVGRGKWGLPVADAAPFPLWDELKPIVSRKTPDLLIVDDVHCFGKDVNGWQAVSQKTLDQWLEGRLRKSAIVGDQYLAALE